LAFTNAFPQQNLMQPGSNSLDNLGSAISKFHTKLWPEISSTELGNVFYSPVGLHAALSHIYSGSPKGSDTNSELASLLQVTTEEDNLSYPSKYQLAINSLLEQ